MLSLRKDQHCKLATVILCRQLDTFLCCRAQTMVAKAMATITDEGQKAVARAMLLPLHQRLIEPAEIAVCSSALQPTR